MSNKNLSFGIAREEIIKTHNLTQSTKQHNQHITSCTLAALGAIQEAVKAAREDAENTGAPVVHVKDGKPLTEHGARLLGVPWTRRPA